MMRLSLPLRRKPARVVKLTSSLNAVADWISSNPRAPASFDDDAFVFIANDLMAALTPHGIHKVEIRAALLKALASVEAVDVLHGSDEQVYALSSKLREDFYSEVMRLRRAMLRDIEDGNF